MKINISKNVEKLYLTSKLKYQEIKLFNRESINIARKGI